MQYSIESVHKKPECFDEYDKTRVICKEHTGCSFKANTMAQAQTIKMAHTVENEGVKVEIKKL